MLLDRCALINTFATVVMVILSRLFHSSSRTIIEMWGNQSCHVKCRGTFYPKTSNQIRRFPVPDDKLDWKIQWDQYDPPNFNAPHIKGQSWADPDINMEGFSPKFNHMDGKINRKSHMGEYPVSSDGYPLNPAGRTGIRGRGVLGRWGPNHAADPIITRWARDSTTSITRNKDTGKPILQFVAIQRNDSGEWAIPGGMVDPDENFQQTAQREFLEEAMDSEKLSQDQLQQLREKVAQLFSNGQEIYIGYVDDPRNTDNSWMETVAINYHADGDQVDGWQFKAGSDAKHVAWLEVSSSLNLYASHVRLMQLVASRHQAHW